MELNEAIKLIRYESRLSQQEFSEELGCSQAAISSYELGTRKPRYDVLKKLDELAKRFKVKVKLL